MARAAPRQSPGLSESTTFVVRLAPDDILANLVATREFEPTHARMAALELRRDTPPHLLAAELRRAFSGIVAGNVKDQGTRLIEQHGPFELHGDQELLRPLDGLLESFVRDRRMKITGEYRPCYRLVA